MKNSCFGNDTIKISLIPTNIQFPNAFSPNGDGINDLFEPILTGLVSDFQIELFNRFGEMVWNSISLTDGWDGYFKGNLCPVDMYVWQMQYKITSGEKTENHRKTGSVSLVR